MLSDEQIEQLLYKYTSRQDEFNMAVIRLIAARLANLAVFDDVDAFGKIEIKRKDMDNIQKIYAKYLEDQKKQIKEDFWWIAVVVYLESVKFYENKIDLQMNKALMSVINQGTRTAQQNLMKLLSSPVFIIRDLKTPAVYKTHGLKEAYTSVVNEALMYSNVSNELRDIALKRTETQLFDSGIRYKTNDMSDNAHDTTSANSAIRMTVLESVKDLINKMQDVMGEQFGANAVELSAHIYPAPDHAPAQGHQYALDEVEKMQSGLDFKDLTGTVYAGFERQIGEWNCRHYFMRIKKGAEPQYTQEQLNKILEDNERGYTDEKGKHRTLYECTQVQRRYEREIRRAKEQYLYGKTLNDQIMMHRARNRVGRLVTRYKQFSRACDIPAKLERIKVKDYK